MEYIWRLLVAIFLVCLGATSLLTAYVFAGGVFGFFCVYAFFVLVAAGVIKGIIVIVDYHINKKHQDDE